MPRSRARPQGQFFADTTKEKNPDKKQRYSHPGVSRKHLSTGRKLAIKAMLDSGISQYQVAILENVSTSTVNMISKDQSLRELDPQIVEKTKKMLASRFYVLADRSIDKAMQEKRIDKMSSYQLTMMGAVSTDKARLMDGLSTENVSVRSFSDTIATGLNELSKLKRVIDDKIKIYSEEESANFGKANNNPDGNMDGKL